MSYTKGPWEAVKSVDNCCTEDDSAVWGSIMSDEGYYVARIWNDIEEDCDETQPKANARLISAAPDMAEALRDLLEDYRFAASEWDMDARAQADLLIEQARAALAKAGL